MRIGNNRERVKIVAFNSVRDAGGGYLNAAADPFAEPLDPEFGTAGETVYWETNAQVKDIKDKYKAEVYGVGLEESIVFTVRNRSDKLVTKLMQVIFKNKYYTIHGIMDAGYRGRELELVCKMKE